MASASLRGDYPNKTLTISFDYLLFANGMVKTMSVTHPSPGGTDVDTYQYDSLGNLTSVSDGLGHTTHYHDYNGLGEPTEVVGPNNDVTNYTYDGRGLVLSKTTHINNTPAQWNYLYDQFGMVKKITAPDGEVTTWNRDATATLRTITHNDKDGASTETFEYDANGDVTSDTVIRNGTVSLTASTTYDELGRPYLQRGVNGQSLTYTYDGNSNVKSVTNAAGHVVSLDYDELNRVKKRTESGGASEPIPTAAPSLSAPANSSTGNYTVNWTSVSGATGYTLQQLINGEWKTVEYTASTTWNAVGKSNGTYTYNVLACNSSGCGPASATASVSVRVVPGAPSVSVPTSNANGAYTVSWTAVAYATSYTLQEQINGGAWANVYTGAARSWSTSSRVAGIYSYRVMASNTYGYSGWSAVDTITVSIPIGLNGKSYLTITPIPAGGNPITPGGGSATGSIGIRIASGATWQVFREGLRLGGGTVASGSIPTAAVKVRFTWTFVGVPSGYLGGQGGVSNAATSPVEVSDNPASEYKTKTWSGATTQAGSTYSVKVDFFNATGSNISSSTCTLTAEVEAP